MKNTKQSLIRIPNGYDKCRYAFFPGIELCASAPEQAVLSYDAIVQQHPDSAIFISEPDSETLRNEWAAIGKPIIITANSSDTLLLSQSLPEARIESLYEKFAEWNIFGSCVHDRYNMTGENKNVNHALKALLETMGAKIEENAADDSLPILTYDMKTRNALLADGRDAYYAMELFFDGSSEEESEHNHDSEHDHERHTQKQLRSPAECRAALCTDNDLEQNMADVIETIQNLFFSEI